MSAESPAPRSDAPEGPPPPIALRQSPRRMLEDPRRDPRLLGRYVSQPRWLDVLRYSALAAISAVLLLTGAFRGVRDAVPGLLVLAVLANGVAVMAALHDVRRSRTSRALYLWDWLSIGAAVAGLAYALLFGSPPGRRSWEWPVALGVIAGFQIVQARRRRARRERVLRDEVAQVFR